MSEQKPQRGPSDERVEAIISDLLRIGVISSALIVSCAGLFYLIQHGRQPAPDLSQFKPEQLRKPVQILREASSLNVLALILVGLLLLVATPVARVLFSVLAFFLQRDYLYVTFTLIVFSVLV